MWRGVSATLLPPNGKGIQVTLPLDKDREGGAKLAGPQEEKQVKTEPTASSSKAQEATATVGEPAALVNSRQVPHSASASSSTAEVAPLSSIAAPGPCLIRKEPEV